MMANLRHLVGLQRNGYEYLASPYTKFPGGHQAAFDEVCRAAAWLLDRGLTVFSPVAHTHPIARHVMTPPTHRFWLDHDLPLLAAARGMIVYQMDGWDESAGIREEMEFAKGRGMPVLYLRRNENGYTLSESA